MERIDKLTLELLMNKTTRQKYVEKTYPVLHEQEKTFKEKLEFFSKRILDITKSYLEDPDKQITLDMNHAFYEYANRCIEHFEDVDVNMNDGEIILFDK
jgi:transcription elongation factor GreA-like protein